ncbi:MAG: TraR/DksA family transcriptional regulator [Bacteriovoracaceae bacterium]|jgi:DnaK suppressor protein|nr:conjugal transfer protein TraR [Halobacteriovoraceae bacterium]MDP7320164.1 TraR/DksA family transcriptional regulator [Bacteriovoracaceae bacterium]|tara:strand:- start:402 stop:776 length:375 start_codon:yes stop_codon:yes gene_type:complete
MNEKKIQYFKKKLLEARNQIVNSGILNNLEDLKIRPDDIADEADMASSSINQQVSFSIREKEMNKLRRIDAALARIEEGNYGYCIESGEEIEEKRLETQPWAEFCIEVAEEHERDFNQRFHRRA